MINQAILALPESRLLERKSTLGALESREAKGRLLRSLLALANSTSGDERAYLLVGVADAKDGGAVIGLEKPIDADTVSRLLHHYTQPIPDVRVHTLDVEGKAISCLEVRWTESWPYYATRDIEPVLSSSQVYHRVGATVATVRPVELESWIRAKVGRTGLTPPSQALRCGFIERGAFQGPTGPIFRVENISGAPIQDIFVTFDLRAADDATIFRRSPALGGMRLDPGASRECECDLRTSLWKDNKTARDQHKIMDRWVNVTAVVEYRDELGYFASETHTILLFS